jgi:lysozyme
MQTSDKGRAFVAAHEGIVTRAYRDVAGVWTIGVGHTAAAGPPKPKAGMAITRDEALAILAADLPKYERRVAAALPGASQPVFDGAVSFDFNTGAVHRASWVRELNAGRREAARRALMQWTKAGGRTVAGLVRRREAEARLIFAGDYGAGAAGVAAPSADMRAVQEDLAALGFDPGPIDGIAGAKTRAAVLAYQRRHPDLVADGIAGPATRASLSRDLAARKAVAGAAAAAAGTAVATVAGANAAGEGAPLLWGLAAGAALLLVLAVFLVRRYGGELRRLLFRKKGP